MAMSVRDLYKRIGGRVDPSWTDDQVKSLLQEELAGNPALRSETRQAIQSALNPTQATVQPAVSAANAAVASVGSGIAAGNAPVHAVAADAAKVRTAISGGAATPAPSLAARAGAGRPTAEDTKGFYGQTTPQPAQPAAATYSATSFTPTTPAGEGYSEDVAATITREIRSGRVQPGTIQWDAAKAYMARSPLAKMAADPMAWAETMLHGMTQARINAPTMQELTDKARGGSITRNDIDLLQDFDLTSPNPQQVGANIVGIQTGQPVADVESPTGQFGGRPPEGVGRVGAVTPSDAPLTEEQKTSLRGAINSALTAAGYSPQEVAAQRPAFTAPAVNANGFLQKERRRASQEEPVHQAPEIVTATGMDLPKEAAPAAGQFPLVDAATAALQQVLAGRSGGQGATFTPTVMPDVSNIPTPDGAPPQGFTPQALSLPQAQGAPRAERPDAFQPTEFVAPSTAPSTPEDLARLARAATAARFGPQQTALQQESERVGLEEQQQAAAITAAAAEEEARLRRGLATSEERMRETFGARNLGVAAGSGFLAGAMGLAQGETAQGIERLGRDRVRKLADLAARSAMARRQIGERQQALTAAEGEEQMAYIDRLARQDREFGLAEKAQALQQWLAENNMRLQANEQNQEAFEADRAFDESARRFGIDTAIRTWQATNQVNEAAARLARQVYESDRSFQEQVRQFGINQALQQWLAQNQVALEAAQFGEGQRRFDQTFAVDAAQAALAAGRTAALLPEEQRGMALTNRGWEIGNQAANDQLHIEQQFRQKYGFRPEEAALEAQNLAIEAAKVRNRYLGQQMEAGLAQSAAETDLARARTANVGVDQPTATETFAQEADAIAAALMRGDDPTEVLNDAIAEGFNPRSISQGYALAGKQLPTAPPKNSWNRGKALVDIERSLRTLKGQGATDDDAYASILDQIDQYGGVVSPDDLVKMVGRIFQSPKYGHKAPGGQEDQGGFLRAGT